jgi:Mor family transcriptional regulator
MIGKAKSEKYKDLAAEYQGGMTIAELAVKYEVCRSVIWQALRARDVPRRKQGPRS